jgi:2,3-bisphosphoglycerate-independent phosphoglycerate mutase
MVTDEVLTNLAVESSSRIVLLVIDGLGGLPERFGGPTELEAAKTPNLDALAERSLCGMMEPISIGITPGSGPAHLALFGYDPFRYTVGRGVLAAMGVGFDLQPSDVAVRINFATIDDNGLITDRRAGRISTAKNEEFCHLLQKVVLPDVDVFIRPVREHRAMAVFRGEGLSGSVTDSDPQKTGQAPRKVAPLPGHEDDASAVKTAHLANEYIDRAGDILQSHAPANFILLRGFDQYHPFPSMRERYKLKAAAVAVYPMYKGVARLVGMDVLPTGETVPDELQTLSTHFEEFTFFFVHVKKTDSAGEDGNFQGKVQALEELDGFLPELLALEPDVVAVTGDHSTPSLLKAHSWHPVPFLLCSTCCRPDAVQHFSERDCSGGGLGRFSALHVMPLVLANALKLQKYGA